MAPPLPPGFVLDKKKAPPLPPGFVLDKVAQPAAQPTAGVDPNLVGLPVPGANGGVDPAYNVPGYTPQPAEPEVGFFNNPGRALDLGLQSVRQGMTDVAGAPMDISRLVSDLLVRPAVDAIPGVDLGPNTAPTVGGSQQLFDLIESIVPGDTIARDDMTGLERFGYEGSRFGTSALIPSATLAMPAVRGAAVASKIPIAETLTRPYANGVTPVSDVVAGVGAGMGMEGYDQAMPEPVKEALGPLGQMLAALVGGVGANTAQIGVEAIPGVVGGTARSVIGPKPMEGPWRKPDGSGYSSQDADAAALFVQNLAARPDMAARNITEGANALRGFANSADGIPTAGPLSGDVGLIAAEKGARQNFDMAKKFALRDQAVERAALDNAGNIAPASSVGRAFTDAADAEYAARVAAAQQGLDTATGNLSARQAEAASDAFMLQGNRGLEVPASTRLHRTIVDDYLRPAQDSKNKAFDAIDPQGTEYRDPTALLNVADEIEMSNGVLADPATVPSDWIGRIRSLVDEDGNVSQVSFKDLNDIRPQLSEQIAQARAAGNFTLADNLRKIKGVLDTEADRLAAEAGSTFDPSALKRPPDVRVGKGDRERRLSLPSEDHDTIADVVRAYQGNDPNMLEAKYRQEIIDELASKGATENEYWQSMSSSAREPLQKGESWQNRAKALVDYNFWRAVDNGATVAGPAQGGDAGVRAKSALAEYARFAQTWARGPGDEAARFRKDYNLDRVNETKVPASDTAGRFIKPADPERAASLRRIVEGDPNADTAVRDFLMADLARANVIRNGRIDPAAVGNWMSKWGDDALNLSPTLRRELDAVMQKSGVDATTIGNLERELSSAAKDFAKVEGMKGPGVGQNPVNAINTIFNSSDPERTVRDLVARFEGDQNAIDGFKAAVREYLIERGTTAGLPRTGDGRNPLSFARLDSLFKQHERTLAEVFTPEEMNSLRVSHKFLASLENLKSSTVPGSQTSPNSRLAKMWDELSGPLEAGLKFRFGILKGGGIMRTLGLWQKMLPGGMDGAQGLIERMYFDPELAAHLLTRDVKEVGTSRWNIRLIMLLSAGQSSQDMVEPDVEN